MTAAENIISFSALIITFLLLIFAVDWRHFRDWIVIFLFKSHLDCLWGGPVIKLNMLEYPNRFLPTYYERSLLFEFWVFPILCVLYNQVTMRRGIGPIIYYAALFSAVITLIEYPLELYTNLIHYIDWSWFTTFYTLLITFLISRTFIAFFRWGCDYFQKKQ